MRSSHKIAALSLIALSGMATLAMAHPREYVRTDFTGVGLTRDDVLIYTCIDDQWKVTSAGGAIQSVTGAVGGILDPSSPDVNGSCWRKNHIFPNANGDVTFSVSDTVQTNVGACLSQDTHNNNGFICHDSDDLEAWFCNQVTVNVNIDPNTGGAFANAWRFQDSQGVASKDTMLVPVRLLRGAALLYPLIGNPIFIPCGPDTDGYATAGQLLHT